MKISLGKTCLCFITIVCRGIGISESIRTEREAEISEPIRMKFPAEAKVMMGRPYLIRGSFDSNILDEHVILL